MGVFRGAHGPLRPFQAAGEGPSRRLEVAFQLLRGHRSADEGPLLGVSGTT